jgi:succinyl-CoA synthetase beta subunit
VALDAKMSFDDHALYRHPEIRRLHDDYEDPDRVIRAARYGFQYAEFGEGTIGCIVNGDGLVLTAVDLLDHTPERVSCFLKVKGAVDKDKIAEGIKIIMSNPRVEGILMNILGGFLRCDLVADGIVSAASEVGLNVPLVVRMEGTNKKDAQEILQRSDLPVVMTETLEEGVELLLKAMEEN